MATSPRIQELVARWEELYRAGQNAPADELCEDGPLAAELQQEIDRRLKKDTPLSGVTEDVPQPQNARQAPATQTSSLSTTSTYGSAVFHTSGGRGEVWRAEQVDLQRDVALKLLKRTGPKDPEIRDRFQFEARATSQLDHPGVAPVYAVGETADGLPFYAMRFISGASLDAEIAEFHETDWSGEAKGRRRQAFHALLRHLVSAAKTIAYAHKRSILNLDIKPLNIMVGKYGETLIVDWGEALPIDDPKLSLLQTEGPLPVARKDENRGHSSSSLGGTLPYMAPERLSGGDQSIGPATDVYSLGASLYQLLCGAEPFAEGNPSRNEVIQRIRQQRLIRPSVLEPDAQVPRPLEAICLKAMAREPAQRYATALDFARDLERWLDDEPVHAHRESTGERCGRWLRRHQTSTWVIGASLVTVIALLTVMSLFLTRAKETAETARRQCLHLAAESTSRLVSRAFEKRWLILEDEAERSELLERIAEADQRLRDNGELRLGNEGQQELQDCLLATYNEWKTTSHASSMLILNVEGIVLARVPEEKNTKNVVGRSFRFRDYFHGDGRDYSDDEVSSAAPTPISHRHVSIPFRSKDNDTLRVQFTVPVKSGSDTVAVLGMAVNLSQFEELQSKDASHPLVLVDLRPTKIDQQLPTLILHHPGMTKPGLHALGDQQFRQQLQELMKIHRYAEPKQRVGESWYTGYVDPVVYGTWRCAIEPLRVRKARDSDREPLDMVVLAQERIGNAGQRTD